MEQGGKALAACLKPAEACEVKSDLSNEVGDAVRSLSRTAEHWLRDPARLLEAQSALDGVSAVTTPHSGGIASGAGSRSGPTGPDLGMATVTLPSRRKSTPFCDENMRQSRRGTPAKRRFRATRPSGKGLRVGLRRGRTASERLVRGRDSHTLLRGRGAGRARSGLGPEAGLNLSGTRTASVALSVTDKALVESLRPGGTKQPKRRFRGEP
jgi:hypothetical protein